MSSYEIKRTSIEHLGIKFFITTIKNVPGYVIDDLVASLQFEIGSLLLFVRNNDIIDNAFLGEIKEVINQNGDTDLAVKKVKSELLTNYDDGYGMFWFNPAPEKLAKLIGLAKNKNKF